MFIHNFLRLQSKKFKGKRLANLQRSRVMSLHRGLGKHFLWVATDACTEIEISANLTAKFANRPCTLDAFLLVEVTSKRVIHAHDLSYMRKRQA